MRISDARYSRDLHRYQLAWRFIQHGARTRTVQRWTGLSMHRVRAMYATYASEGGERSPLRGVAPYQVSFFWRSRQLRSEAAVLVGFLSTFDVLPSSAAAEPWESISRGERLCRAYEEFKACWPTAQSTLEHALLLACELARGVEMAVERCTECDVLIVVDQLAIAPPWCAFCLHEREAGRSYGNRIIDGNGNAGSSCAGSQTDLF